MTNKSELSAKTLYPAFERNQRWRDEVAHQATRKALDLPDDNMQLEANKMQTVNNNGVHPAWMVGILAAAVGLPMLKDFQLPKSTPAPVADAKRYAPIEYRWHVADGKKVEQYRENGGEWKAVPPGGIVVNPIK